MSPCTLEVLLLTLKEALIQVWSYQLDHLELDLEPLIQELQAGPTGCRTYLKIVITDIRDLLDRKWHITLNYAHRDVNLTASVLAMLHQNQTEALVVHFVPSSMLEPALELNKETYLFARKLQEVEDSNDMP